MRNEKPRSYLRLHHAPTTVLFSVGADATDYSGTLRNSSVDGLYLETSQFLPPHAEVYVKTCDYARCAHDLSPFQAEVKWVSPIDTSTPCYGLGLQYKMQPVQFYWHLLKQTAKAFVTVMAQDKKKKD